jgi:hypothetical protein
MESAKRHRLGAKEIVVAWNLGTVGVVSIDRRRPVWRR